MSSEKCPVVGVASNHVLVGSARESGRGAVCSKAGGTGLSCSVDVGDTPSPLVDEISSGAPPPLISRDPNRS